MHGADDPTDADLAVIDAIAAIASLRPREHESAVAWLVSELDAAERRGRPVQVAVLRERARAAGWSWSSVQRARSIVGPITVRRPVECWRLPLPRER